MIATLEIKHRNATTLDLTITELPLSKKTKHFNSLLNQMDLSFGLQTSPPAGLSQGI